MAKKTVTQNATHTPGPWKFKKGAKNDDKTRGTLGEIESGGGFYLAAIWADVEELEPYAEANARLMAAAPDLLAALKMLSDSGVNLAEPIESAMLAAIAKAEGYYR